MPFAVNLERKEILFLLIIMKDREEDIQINDKSSVSVFLVSVLLTTQFFINTLNIRSETRR